MNKYQKEILDIIETKLKEICDVENQNLQEKIQYLIESIFNLKLIENYDLLEDDIVIKKTSDNSIGIYFQLRKNTKLIIIIDEFKYEILFKRNIRENWQSKYIDNVTELEYTIQEFL